MKLPAEDAVIPPEKLRDYILSPSHSDGRAKAKYLARLGYSQASWQRLEEDLRAQILGRDAQPLSFSHYGQKYEILGITYGTEWHSGMGPNHLDRPHGRYIAAAGDANPGGEAMTYVPFQRVVLTKDLHDQGLRAGDVGVVVGHYPGRGDIPEGYELEFFAATGETIAVVSVPATSIREATGHEVLSVRVLART